ncbi:MAG: 50S ribosomal protein L13 [Nanoarchaeota archaeon]|nr:50S ribosomal protein L13 [Nanoarchaeota archaeon]
MIIDAKEMIIGRIATVAAKKALLGEKVDIINCESAVISGKKKFTIDDIKRRKDMGTYKGPFLSRMPDRFVRRIIRGMLPYKQDKGKNAYKRVKCYIGLPKEFEGKNMVKIENAHVSKVKDLNYITIEDISKKLSDKKRYKDE